MALIINVLIGEISAAIIGIILDVVNALGGLVT